MPGPPPALAAARVAVRRWLGGCDLADGALVLVACSGGADSLALAAAVGFVAPREGYAVAAVTVDHGLQPGSADAAREAADRCRALLPGGSPVEVVQVAVPASGAGPEADARAARYAALQDTARRLGAAAVLLGHTRDDQAEQVLLGLARGSGTRSLAGMPARRPLGEGRLLGRPLLALTRQQTSDVCAELGLAPFRDPHNEDRRYARVRARQALALLEGDLGPGLTGNLARSADLLRDDADALDALADAAYLDLGEQPWAVPALTALPRAVRTRLWRRLALEQGSPGTDLTGEHLRSVDALVTAWRGQGPLPLPGGVRAARTGEGVQVRGEA